MTRKYIRCDNKLCPNFGTVMRDVCKLPKEKAKACGNRYTIPPGMKFEDIMGLLMNKAFPAALGECYYTQGGSRA